MLRVRDTDVQGLSGKYRAYLYISTLALFVIIGRVTSFKVIPTWLNNWVPAMFPLFEAVLELTFRDGLEYARHIIFTWVIPKILFKISQTVVFCITRSFSSSLTVNRRSPSIASRIRSILYNVFVVEVRPERESLSTEVRPPLKRLYHSYIRVLLIHSSPKAFCIIWIVSELMFSIVSTSQCFFVNYVSYFHRHAIVSYCICASQPKFLKV